MEKEYTLLEIKIAFWNKFHRSDENWFDNWPDNEEQNQYCTETYWREFLYELTGDIDVFNDMQYEAKYKNLK